MVELVPVEHDPFATSEPASVTELQPVDHDPFAVKKAPPEAYEGWDVPSRDPNLATPAQIKKDKELQAKSDATLKALEPSEPGLAHLLMAPVVGAVRYGQAALGERPIPKGVDAMNAAAFAVRPSGFNPNVMVPELTATAKALGGAIPKGLEFSRSGQANRPIPEGETGTIFTQRPALENAIPYQEAAGIAKRVGAATRAEKTITKRINEAGPTTTQEAIDALNEARESGKPMMLPDVLQGGVQKLAGRMYRAPGESSEIIGEALRGRNAGAVGRLTGDINRDVGSGSAYQMFDELRVSRSQQAKPLFEKAFEGGSIAPLENQFENAFSELGAEEQAAQRELNNALSVKQTAAAARASQAGDNVYANAGANTGLRVADAVEAQARARLDAATATKEQMRERLQQAQADRTAEAPGAIWSPRLQEFLENPRVQEGINRGWRIERDEALAESRPVNPSEYAVTGFTEAGDPIVGRVPTMRLLAVAKEGIDRMLQSPQYRNELTGQLNKEGVAIAKLQREFLGEIDRLNPDYKAARDVWAGETASMEALKAGQTALKNKPEINARLAADMTEGEREFAKLGLAQTLREVAGDKGPLAGEFNTIAGTEYGAEGNRSRIAPFFNDEAALTRFVDSVGQEQTMARTKNKIMGGSQTAERGMEDQGPMNFRDTAHAAISGALGHPGQLLHHAVKPVKWLWDHRDPAFNAEMAKVLSDIAITLGQTPEGKVIIKRPGPPP